MKAWPRERGKIWDYSLPDAAHSIVCDGENVQFEIGAMTLHEVGEVLRRAAYTKGLYPQPEYKVVGRRVDWVWKDATGLVVAAFEIEGQDVEKSKTRKSRGMKKDCESMMAIQSCEHRYIILYQVSKTGEPKGFRKKYKTAEACRTHYEEIAVKRFQKLKSKHPEWNDIELIFDSDLFNAIDEMNL